MIKVLINGCNGKMGQEVANAISRNDNFQTICGVDKLDTGDNNFPVYTDTSLIKEEPDVIIDFSIPAATFNILEYAKSQKIPVVIATTGFLDEELEKIKEYSKEIPIFKSANMSFEISLMSHIVSEVTKYLPKADIEIIETHHNRKIDAPSGTALVLADKINETLNNEKYYEFNRHAKREKRNPKEIGIHSIRGGNIVGTHTVKFFTETESFEVTHTAQSRGVFADGSLRAAEFLVVQDPGLYNMDNIFNK
ncbi:MAG: 4-hydroxy-tetrahydrodipicolinate reductase [Clostridia bacterium]